MLVSHLKIAARNLRRQRGYALINVLGLALGIACCLLILLYVRDELSYDAHYPDVDRTYRVAVEGSVAGNTFEQAVSSAPMAAALMREFPEIEMATRFRSYGYPVFRYGEKAFSEEKIYWADSTFFDVFPRPFLAGDAASALNRPETIVLTESMARKYFGTADPIGKRLNADNRRDYVVTGVIPDFPANGHFHFDAVAALISYKEDADNNRWVSHNFYTYFRVRPDADITALQTKVNGLVPRYVGPQIEAVTGVPFAELGNAGGYLRYRLQPIGDIHLHSDLDYEIESNGDITYIYLFAAVAIGILLIACINYMNLATARSANRAREVGIRKTLGSNRRQLIRQFLTESVLMSLLAFLLAVLLVWMLLPVFNTISGKTIDFARFGHPLTLAAILAFAALVGILAGSYPAFFLAAFPPVTTLKGGVTTRKGSPLLRSALVVFQFAISVGLIIGTFVVADQMDYIRNKRLGFTTEQVLVIHKTDDIGDQIFPFRDQLRQMPAVRQVSSSTTLPGLAFGSTVFRLQEAGGEASQLLWTANTDHYFADVFDIELRHGRYFDPTRPADTAAVIINETAMRMLGGTNPIGQTLLMLGPTADQNVPLRIIGVTRDFHFESLHQTIRPLAILPFGKVYQGRYLSVRLAATDLPRSLAEMETVWKRFAGGQAFEYTFFDEDFAQLYAGEMRTGTLLTAFAAVAIFIACLGLFGLASFITLQRTKEIGIRKVLGATVPQVVVMLGKEFARWVVVANLIAWPVAWWVMHRWLEGFAYRTAIRWEIFLAAALLALLTAILTVSYQTIRAALINPAKSIRYE